MIWIVLHPSIVFYNACQEKSSPLRIFDISEIAHHLEMALLIL